MGENVLRRFYNNVLAIIREISVEPAYLGMALSWGLYGIVSSELYISKVREKEDHCAKHESPFVKQSLGQSHMNEIFNFCPRYARSTWPSVMRSAIIFRDWTALSTIINVSKRALLFFPKSPGGTAFS